MEPSSISSALESESINLLTAREVELVKVFLSEFKFTSSQARELCGWFVDARMWGEDGLPDQFGSILYIFQHSKSKHTSTQKREGLFAELRKLYGKLKASEKEYPQEALPENLPVYRFENKELKGKYFRVCQAYSGKTVCCKLKVLNIIDNCAMECSYCILHNHYSDVVVKIPDNLKSCLDNLEVPEGQKMRVGTGEHSDSLLWGNHNNILDDLCCFAAAHPNIILELKTKSDNIEYFKRHKIPGNVCCTWSLNSPVIISHEEHKTVSLESRLAAAREAADLGVKTGFHLHPMIFYKGWERDYQAVIEKVIDLFSPEEVLWFSLGTVTIIKGLEKELHKKFKHSRILQMDTEKTPDGKKQTYKFEIRKRLYQNAMKALEPWNGRVVIYLCMEDARMWHEVMGMECAGTFSLDDYINDSAFSKIEMP